MKRSIILSLSVLVVLIAVIVVVKLLSPEPLNTKPTFDTAGKEPFDTYILDKLIREAFDSTELIDRTIFEYVRLNKSFADQEHANYLEVGQYAMYDEKSFEELLDWVSKGNTAFLFADGFDERLRDTLKFDMNTRDNLTFGKRDQGIQYSRFSNIKIDPDQTFFKCRHYLYPRYFECRDSINTVILCTDDEDAPNTLMIKFGKGRFIVGTTECMFSNHSLSSYSTSGYAAKILSYSDPKGPFYLEASESFRKKESDSILRVIKANLSLSFALYIVLAAVLLFALFKAKRLQRIIPVVNPLSNSSAEFADTVSLLYFSKKMFTGAAKIKIRFFKDFLRYKLRLDNGVFDEDFMIRLSEKTGYDLEALKKIFTSIRNVEADGFATANELIKFNSIIDDFYLKVNNGKFE